MPSRLQQRVVDEFATWASTEGIVPDGEAGQQWRDRITVLLQGRTDHLDRPDPTRWRSGDVHELFMSCVVPEQVDLWGLTAHGLDTIRDFLRFLDATDRLHPGSTRVSTLLKELDRLAPKYPAAMADTSRWELDKRVFTAIQAAGISLDADPGVLDAWAEWFNTRGPEDRRTVLGELMDQRPGYAGGRMLIHDGQVAIMAPGMPLAKHLIWPDKVCDCGCEPEVEYPPVSLPDLATLAKLVTTDGSGFLRRLAELAAWAGDGRKTVDSRGEPRKADRPAVAAALGLPSNTARPGGTTAPTRLWQMAIELDVIQLRRARVIPGAGARLIADVLAGDSTPEQTLDLWSDIADALIEPQSPSNPSKDHKHMQAWSRPWTPRFLGILYADTGAGDSGRLETIAEQLLDKYAAKLSPGEPDMFAHLAGAVVRNALVDLASHGAVTITTSSDDVAIREAAAAASLGTQTWALHAVPGIVANLTDLGRYLVRRRLLAENAHAPLAD